MEEDTVGLDDGPSQPAGFESMDWGMIFLAISRELQFIVIVA
jgi:hypothetical protein